MIAWRAQLVPLGAVAAIAGVAALVFGGAFGQVITRMQFDGARYRLTVDAAREAQVTRLPARGDLRFAAGVAVRHRRLVRRAISDARPEARRLIGLVAALVTIDVRPLGGAVAGETSTTDRGYDIALDLDPVRGGLGLRGVRQLTLHELGHVIDDALVTEDLERRLDDATPPGFVCEGNRIECPARAERFAESFAKWATGDPGDDLSLGYRVPAPVPLAAWGAPLRQLTR